MHHLGEGQPLVDALAGAVLGDPVVRLGEEEVDVVTLLQRLGQLVGVDLRTRRVPREELMHHHQDPQATRPSAHVLVVLTSATPGGTHHRRLTSSR